MKDSTKNWCKKKREECDIKIQYIIQNVGGKIKTDIMLLFFK